MSEIKVYVFRRQGRKFFQGQWTDPVTGKQITQSLKTSIRREADRKAGRIEDDLRNGRYLAAKRMPWKQFRERYETDVVSAQAATTAPKVSAVFNAIETHIKPGHLQSLTAEQLSRFQNELRQVGLEEATIIWHT